tara:strand:- start:2231 stop:2437 length:207 start_codon:yes stop_codon:yes gene_type:complete
MKTFKELREFVITEESVKSYTVGKHKITINKKGSKFAASIDGELLDSSFKSVKDAEDSVSEFIELMNI